MKDDKDKKKEARFWQIAALCKKYPNLSISAPKMQPINPIN